MLRAQGLADVLRGGSLRVSGGGQSATAPLDDGFPALRAGAVILQATFGEQDANFEWSESAALTATGVALDVTAKDLGRKTPGTVWTLTTAIEVATDG